MEREQFSVSTIRGPRSPAGIALPVLSDTGFSNLDRTHIFGGLIGQSAPWMWHTYFNDFDSLAEFNGITDTADWDVTTTGSTPTFALTDGDNGLAIITLSTADNDHVFYQKKGESFKYVARSPLLFGMRFKVVDATQCDIIAGLMITDTTPLTTVTDGIYFQKDDGDAYLDFHVAKNTTATDVTNLATLVDDTFITLQFAYDGGSKIWYGTNGSALGSVALTNVSDDEELTISFGIQAGEATNVKTMTIDYVYAAKYTGRS